MCCRNLWTIPNLSLRLLAPDNRARNRRGSRAKAGFKGWVVSQDLDGKGKGNARFFNPALFDRVQHIEIEIFP